MPTKTALKNNAVTENSVDTFYACKICTSQAPNHVCIITPEKNGACGQYDYDDSKTTYENDTYGPKQPVSKGKLIDTKLGQWQGVNEYVVKASGGRVKRVSLYSILREPATASMLCEAISAVLPKCNGVMTVSREYKGKTPSGMTFKELVEIVGGGEQTPGMIGHSKDYITQPCFLGAEGGLKRIAWMNKSLKGEIGKKLEARTPGLLEKIADEAVGVTEEAILPFLKQKKHPALRMKPLLN